MKIALITILLLVFISCNNKKLSSSANTNDIINFYSSDNLIQSKNKVAFIKSNENNMSYISKESDFGDIYIFDLQDSSLFRITEDNYYEECLTWSPDGTKLLFASTREKQYRYHESDGTIYNDLFVFDLKLKQIRKLYPFNSFSLNIAHFGKLCWTQNGIYFTKLNSIYMINDSGDSLETVASIDSNFSISTLSISPDNRFVAFDCIPISYSQRFEYRIGYIDLVTEKVNWLNIDFTSLGGWSFDSKSFLFSKEDSLLSYNVMTKSLDVINLLASSDTLLIDECYYLNSEELIYITRENAIAKGKNIRDTEVKNDIVIYNLENDSVWFVFNDLREKSNLAPYYSK